jgi:predicted DNA-binding ribbon-helix-helix protein
MKLSTDMAKSSGRPNDLANSIDRDSAPLAAPETGSVLSQAKLRRTSALVSRNLMVGTRRTSARLEPEMWSALFDIARREGRNVHEIATLVDQARPRNSSLTAAIRVFVMAYYRAAATEEGHARAGHGYGRILYPDHNVNAASARLPRQFRQTS